MPRRIPPAWLPRQGAAPAARLHVGGWGARRRVVSGVAGRCCMHIHAHACWSAEKPVVCAAAAAMAVQCCCHHACMQPHMHAHGAAAGPPRSQRRLTLRDGSGSSGLRQQRARCPAAPKPRSPLLLPAAWQLLLLLRLLRQPRCGRPLRHRLHAGAVKGCGRPRCGAAASGQRPRLGPALAQHCCGAFACCLENYFAGGLAGLMSRLARTSRRRLFCCRAGAAAEVCCAQCDPYLLAAACIHMPAAVLL